MGHLREALYMETRLDVAKVAAATAAKSRDLLLSRSKPGLILLCGRKRPLKLLDCTHLMCGWFSMMLGKVEPSVGVPPHLRVSVLYSSASSDAG